MQPPLVVRVALNPRWRIARIWRGTISKNPTMRNLFVVFAALLTLSLAVHVKAGPDAPRRELLDTLPTRPTEPLTVEMKTLIPAVNKNPQDAELAVRLSRTFYQQAVREGELRFIGYARGVLAPWWAMRAPPVEVQLMRANLRQYVHEFNRATDDLTDVLARQPDHVQALAIRAAINTVQADYPAARADCDRLQPLTTELIGFACGASIDALTGKARQSYDALLALLTRHPRVRPEEKLWVLTRLAEMAERIGDHEAAEHRFRQALFTDPRDQYLLAAYADHLLDRQRPAEVVTLLKDRTGAEHLLLRLVLAEQQLGLPAFGEHRKMVEEAFASARRKGHTVHEQEESRFVLHVLGDSAHALTLAVSNWQVQREARDARVVLESALAAGDKDAARPTLRWMHDSGIEDITLRELASRLEK